MNALLTLASLLIATSFGDSPFDAFTGKYKSAGPLYAKMKVEKGHLVMAITDLRSDQIVRTEDVLNVETENKFNFKRVNGEIVKVVFRKGKPLGSREFALLTDDRSFFFTEIASSNKK